MALTFEIVRPEEKPSSRTIEVGGRTLVDGVDFHGDYDAELILKFGIDNLNFVPSTPPRYR